jgi:hypothetical protein
MPTIVVTHQVKDAQHWLSSSTREASLGALGVSNIRTFVDQRDPHRAAVLMDVADLDALTAAVERQDPQLLAAMQQDGVLPETLSVLVES